MLETSSSLVALGNCITKPKVIFKMMPETGLWMSEPSNQSPSKEEWAQQDQLTLPTSHKEAEPEPEFKSREFGFRSANLCIFLTFFNRE
jgi:hypothetical protein